MSKAFGHLDGAWSCLVFFLPIKQHLLTRQHLKCPEEGEWAANKQTGRNSATKVLLKHSPCAGQRVRALLIARAVIFNGLPAPNEKGGLAPGGVMCLAVNLSNHQGSSLLIQRSAVQQGLPGEERPAPRHSPGSAQGIGMAQQLHPQILPGIPHPQGLGLPLTSHRHHTALNLPSARVTEHRGSAAPKAPGPVHPCLTQAPLVTHVPTGRTARTAFCQTHLFPAPLSE